MDEPKKNLNMLDMASNFAKAAMNHAMSGFQNTEISLQQKRMLICNECDSFDQQLIICKDCGCNLNIKTKWFTSSCPRNKW